MCQINDNKILLQLNEVLFVIALAEFPDGMEKFVNLIINGLKSQDLNTIRASLMALMMVTKRFRFKQDNRKPLDELVSIVFPLLLNIQQHIFTLLSQQDVNLFNDLWLLIYYLLKTFNYSIDMQLSPLLHDIKVLGLWLELCIKIIQVPYPNGYIIKDEILQDGEMWRRKPLVRSKKRAICIIYQIINTYGRPDSIDENTNKEYAQLIQHNFAPICTNMFLNLLENHINEIEILTSMMQFKIWKLLTYMIYYSSLWMNNIKPKLNFLLTKAVIKTLCLNDSMIIQWHQNPREYVMRSMNFELGFKDPQVAATEFLQACVKLRTSSTLNIATTTITNEFELYNNKQVNNTIEFKDQIRKEGMMKYFGSLRRLLASNNEMLIACESVLTRYIFPEVNSTSDILITRAIALIGEFCTFQYSNKQISQECINQCCLKLKHKELPIKLQASFSIARYIRLQPNSFHYLLPHIETILTEFFSLIEIIGNEDVVISLTTLLEHLDSDIIPYANAVCSKLIKIFMELYKIPEEDDEEASHTAIQCIKALNSMIQACRKNNQIMIQLESLCLSLMNELLQADGIEYLDDVLEMITIFTSNQQISQNMWTIIFPSLYQAFKEFAIDYYPQMFHIFDNFIAKGFITTTTTTEVLLFLKVNNSNISYLDMILDTIKVMIEDPYQELTASTSCRLLLSILAWGKGQIDHLIANILTLIITKAKILIKRQQDESETELSYLNFLIEVIASCVIYNPILFMTTLSTLHDDDMKFTLNYWFSAIELLADRKLALKLTSIALSSFLLIPSNQLPHNIATYMDNLMSLNLQSLLMFYELQTYLQQQQQQEEEKKQLQNNNLSQTTATLNNLDELSDIWDDVSPAKIEDIPDNQDILNNNYDYFTSSYTVNGGLTNNIEDMGAFLDALAEEEDLELIGEENHIDHLDCFIFFQDSLNHYSNTINSQQAQQWYNNAQLSNEIKQCLQIADQRRLKIQQEQKN